METTALTLPDRDSFIRDIKAINEFQQIVHQHLVEGADWGIIPGTTKPTLLKPGAEKIAKLLGLADQYEIVDRQEDWAKPFFRYLVKCKLIHVASQNLISEGLGECNSMESKYRWRWISERDLPTGIDKTKLVMQERTAKTGGHWTVFRFENDDIYSQVNTILKMGKKRALVDAALSAGRLSNVFTQDMEDLPAEEMTEGTITKAQKERRTVDKAQHYCQIHGVNFFKKGRMKGYAHPIEGTDKWCNEDDIKPEPSPEAPQERTEQATQPPDEETQPEPQAEEQVDPIDLVWLKETLGYIHWKESTALTWIFSQFKVPIKGSLAEVLKSLKPNAVNEFYYHIKLMREASGH